MSFVISSGTSIFEIVERRENAAAAFGAVADLLAKRRPNVRVFDGEGSPVRVAYLERLAGAERVADRKPGQAPPN